MFCRLLTGHCAQGFSNSVLVINNHLNKDAPQQTLLQPDDPWIPIKSDVQPYILEPLDNIKLSRSQYNATSIINYGPYIEHVCTKKFCLCTPQPTFHSYNLKPPISHTWAPHTQIW